MTTYKILVSGNADMSRNGNVHETLSHVLVQDGTSVVAVRNNGNNGTKYSSKEDAENAAKVYTGIYANRWSRTEIVSN